MKHFYKPTYRPATALPREIEWTYAEAPADIAHLRRDIPASRHLHGVIECRELTREERKRWDLEFTTLTSNLPMKGELT